MEGGVLPALILSTLAGMSTAIGSLLALLTRRTSARFLSLSLGFSAGVMVLVSFAELLPDAKRNLGQTLGEASGYATIGCLIGGMLLCAAVDRLLPAEKNPHSPRNAEDMHQPGPRQSLVRMGFFTAVAITIHNFPEGIATFMAGYSDLRLGLPVAISIALHNIPEGIAVAVPIYYGTGSRLKAFSYSALSGLSEPLGAVLAYLILAPFLSSATLGIIFGAVAGIMIYISFDELIPSSERYGNTVEAFLGIGAGILVMWIALAIFGA